MTRWKAAGWHLLISVAVAALAMAVTLGVMYPWTYFNASGASRLLTILLSVDVIIGPALTLLVFKPGKPSLRFDLTCIALLQLAALIYGFSVLVQARPVFLVHVGDRFHLVRANEIEPEQLAKGSDEPFRSLSWTGPRLAVALKPRDADRQQELLMSAIGGADLNYFPETYADYQANAHVVLNRARPVSDLLAREPQTAQPIAKYLETSGHQARDLRYVPLQVGIQFMTALIDAKTAQLYKVVDVDPWE